MTRIITLGHFLAGAKHQKTIGSTMRPLEQKARPQLRRYMATLQSYGFRFLNLCCMREEMQKFCCPRWDGVYPIWTYQAQIAIQFRASRSPSSLALLLLPSSSITAQHKLAHGTPLAHWHNGSESEAPTHHNSDIRLHSAYVRIQP